MHATKVESVEWKVQPPVHAFLVSFLGLPIPKNLDIHQKLLYCIVLLALQLQYTYLYNF